MHTHLFQKSILPLLLLAGLLACQSESSREKPAHPAEGTFVAADSQLLYYRIVGQGPDTLVMLHGGPGMDSEYMIADFMPLAENHTLLFYDQRGGGRSSLPEDSSLLFIDRHVADLEALRTHFGLEQMQLVAHSYGPALATSYALKYPDNVSRMVFLGAIPPMREDFFERYARNLAASLTPAELARMDSLSREMITGEDIKGACRAFWELGLRARIAEGKAVSLIKGDCCAASPEAISYGMSKTYAAVIGSMGAWDFRPQLAELNIPVLILHGEEEPIPMDMAEAWKEALPNGQFIRIPGAAHFVYAERPDIVWPAIEAFLASS